MDLNRKVTHIFRVDYFSYFITKYIKISNRKSSSTIDNNKPIKFETLSHIKVQLFLQLYM